MTALSIVTYGRPRIIGLTPSDTNEATMYTAANLSATAIKIHVANLTASAASATVKWGDGSTDTPIISVFSVPARGYLEEDIIIPMRNTWTIKVTSGTSNALAFSLVILEGEIGVR